MNRNKKDQMNTLPNAYPAHQLPSLYALTPALLKSYGAQAVAIDLDNTAVLDSSYRVPARTLEWVDSMRDAGIPVAIISNTYLHRGWYLSRKMGRLPFIALANKPSVKPIRRMAARLGVPVSALAMVGDQLFTDVLAANRAGAISVRTAPIAEEKRISWYFRRLREKERRFLQTYARKSSIA
ncbi:MAG: YqeG family HAD IIIA-type phosphatase [Clostridia bacterium]|nr:YqeG family HAD IIIA-type phosphatase [Clostridia bacterium]